MMKNMILCVALFVSILFSTPVPVQASQFSDIPDGHWARESVDFMVKKGVLSGYSNGAFRPNEAIDRAELTVMVHKLFNKLRPNLNKESPVQKIQKFEDVPKSHWAYQPLMEMYDANSFGVVDWDWDKVYIYPEKKVTRWDALYFFQSFFGEKMYQMPDDQVLPILAEIDDITIQSFDSTGYSTRYPGSRAVDKIDDGEYTISYSHLDTGELIFANGDIDTLKAYALAWLVGNDIMSTWKNQLEIHDPLTRAEAVVMLHRTYNILLADGSLSTYTSK
ncbi:S-layer homology domain-containing protein [Brevibacillus sp. DP1.3A]|uniref:S-layer homology domain-containing protein n=1 Tax=Brevibacillus sp. DP1.3A TaxID=2738867 RepID=UPI001D169CB4|nr:S-layer homology domain-containing protein [Brevibacillus sp. DP1.3A]UED73703.1 S-layer homology domain-containing protein [Brevibacillus sp. DP1.3A]